MSKWIPCAFLGLAVFAAASPTYADLTATVVISNSFGDSSGADHGGEHLVSYSGFDFTPASLGESPNQFESFCLERNESFTFGATYYVQISTAAYTGGLGGPSPDPLGNETAYLYTQFIRQDLAGYDYANTGPGRVESANALQNLIWFFEDELEGNSYTWGLTAAEALLAEQFYQDALAANWSGIGGVRVLNLYRNADGTGNRQDQLVMVPLPGACLLCAVGLAALFVGRRKSALR